MSPELRGQARELARRSIVGTLRKPVLIVPTLVFPLFMLAVLASAGKQITHIPGFPTKSYITFIIGATLIQGASHAATQTGNALASDIDTGFMSRLALTPVRASILIGSQLAGVAVLGLIQAVLYLLVGLAAGVTVQAGVGGAFVVIAIVVLIDLAFGAIGLFIALRTRSAQEVQALFPLVLVLFFMSSMTMPRNLIKAGWFKTVATINPMSYLVEATRSLFIKGWDAQALELGCGIALAIFILPLVGAIVSMRSRLLRT